MVMTKPSLIWPFLVLTSSLLVACGGSSTPTPSPDTPTPPPANEIATSLIDRAANNYSDYQVAMDASGNGLAVWIESDGSTLNIMSNRYQTGGGWGIPESLEDFPGSIDQSPHLDMNANGDAIVVWGQSNTPELWANRYSPDTGWVGPESLSTDTGSAFNMANPKVSINANGDALVTWSQSTFTPEKSTIWAKMFSPVSGWQTSENLYTISPSLGTYPHDSRLTDNGDALILWIAPNSILMATTQNVMTRAYNSTTGWNAAEELDSYDSDEFDLADYQLEMSTNGKAIAFWALEGITSGRDLIRGNDFTPTTGWKSSYNIHNEFTLFGMDLAVDTFGNGTLLWTALNSGGSGSIQQIQSKRFTSDIGWGDVENISDGLTNAVYPYIDSDSTDTNGSITALWTQSFDNSGSSGERPISRYYTLSNGWDTVLPLNEAPSTIGFTKIESVPNGSGDAIAIWSLPSATPLELISGYITH